MAAQLPNAEVGRQPRWPSLAARSGSGSGSVFASRRQPSLAVSPRRACPGQRDGGADALRRPCAALRNRTSAKNPRIRSWRHCTTVPVRFWPSADSAKRSARWFPQGSVPRIQTCAVGRDLFQDGRDFARGKTGTVQPQRTRSEQSSRGSAGMGVVGRDGCGGLARAARFLAARAGRLRIGEQNGG